MNPPTVSLPRCPFLTVKLSPRPCGMAQTGGSVPPFLYPTNDFLRAAGSVRLSSKTRSGVGLGFGVSPENRVNCQTLLPELVHDFRDDDSNRHESGHVLRCPDMAGAVSLADASAIPELIGNAILASIKEAA